VVGRNLLSLGYGLAAEVEASGRGEESGAALFFRVFFSLGESAGVGEVAIEVA
jgi:hypothetical protein